MGAGHSRTFTPTIQHDQFERACYNFAWSTGFLVVGRTLRRCYAGSRRNADQTSTRKRATASGKQWRKRYAATILGEVHAARAVVRGRTRWQRRRAHASRMANGKSCNGCCMISFADCTLPMRAGWCMAGLPGHSVSTAGNVRFKAMHTLWPGKAATLSSLACTPSRFMWCGL